MGYILPGGDDVRNIKGAPGIIEDVIANLPASALPGTLFVSTDTHELFRFNGATWDSIGAPAVTPTWQQTLIAGSTMTQLNTIDGAGFGIVFNNFANFDIVGTGNFTVEQQSVTIDSVTQFNMRGNGVNIADPFGAELDFAIPQITLRDLSGGSRPMLIESAGALTINSISGQTSIGAQDDINIDSVAGDLVFSTSAGNASLGAPGTYIVDIGNDVTISSDTGIVTIQATANDLTLQSLGGNATLSGTGIVSVGNGLGQLIVDAGGNMTLSGTSIITNDVLNVGAGLFVPTGQLIEYQSAAAAAATNALALPGSVYGSTATLMGAPATWISFKVAGTTYKVAAYL